MNSGLLQLLRTQVIDQCRIVLIEERSIELTLGLVARNAMFANDLVWVHIQNLMNAANNVSKALWGQKTRWNQTDIVKRREPLRKAFEITDQSAFYDVRMRNNFEHFDEKLEDWLQYTPDGSFVDKQIGPLIPSEQQQGKNVLRFFDPETWELGFWDQRFDVSAICSEARGLMPQVEIDDYAGIEPPEDWGEIRKIAEIWSPER
jgi:hypothetical protein